MKRYKKYAVLSSAALLLALTGTIGAYLTDRDRADNKITVGYNDSKIQENFPEPEGIPQPGETCRKVVWAENNSGVPCYIRVLVEASAGTIGKDIILEDLDLKNWIYIQEKNNEKLGGYYYYKEAVPSGGRTSNLFSGVVFTEQAMELFDACEDSMDIIVYEESVQKGDSETYFSAWNSFIRE